MNVNTFTNILITKDKLNENIIIDLKKFIDTCNEKDHTDLKFHIDNEDDNITKFLFYDNKNLISYFALTPSYIMGESYLWGSIHPEYRKSDIFSKSFNCVKEKCCENNISALSVINERTAISFSEFITSVGGRKKYSTYEMAFNIEYYKDVHLECNDMVIKKASLEDIEDIIPIGMEAFETTEEDERAYNESNLNDSKYNNFICKINNNPVGIISAKVENGRGSIADLAVLKSYRKKRIGRLILSKTISYLLNQGVEEFSLSVETQNSNAILLYEHCGFRTVKAYDCYEIKLV